MTTTGQPFRVKESSTTGTPSEIEAVDIAKGDRKVNKCKWPKGVQKACEDLAEILMSGNKGVKNAVLANLEVFKHTVKQDEKIKKLEEGLIEMRRREQQGSLDALDNPAQSKKKKGT